jgi:hypothetical protein
MTVDLAYRRERLLYPADVATAPRPTTLILQKVTGPYRGVTANGLAINQPNLLQDVNAQNVTGNPYGTALGLATYLHLFNYQGTRYLFDLTDGTVYDLNAYDSNTLTIIWPPSW